MGLWSPPGRRGGSGDFISVHMRCGDGDGDDDGDGDGDDDGDGDGDDDGDGDGDDGRDGGVNCVGLFSG